MSLSDKRKKTFSTNNLKKGYHFSYNEEDIKEKVKDLKEKIEEISFEDMKGEPAILVNAHAVERIINETFGEKLI